MNVRLLSLTVVLVVCVSQLRAADKPVHLFVLSGQSNMVGLKHEMDFLPEAKKLLPDAEIVVIKVASGGQPIRYWLKEWDDIAANAGLKQKNEKGPIYYDRILAEFEKVRKQHDKFASVTFCWMQGERDAKTGLAPAYETALKQLISKLRRDLKAPEMNVVIGRLSDHSPGNSQKGWDAVREVQVKIAKNDPHGAWVDTDDLNDKMAKGQKVNDLHYTREGYNIFGQRLARQAVRLINGNEPNATGRPDAPKE